MAFFKPIMTSNKDNIEKHLGQMIFDTTENQIYIDIDDETRKVVEIKIDEKTPKAYIADAIAASELATAEAIEEVEETLTQDIENIKPIYKTIQLGTEDWSAADNLYKYTIVDSSVDENTLINASLDLENQEKMYDGYIDTYDGGYYIYTSILPTSIITMNIVMQKGVKK